MIFCGNPRAQYLTHTAEIDAAIARVLDKGGYILGEETLCFEAEFASYIGVSFGVGAGSGTEALHLALAACDIGSGDEVITVAHTAVATVAAIELAGATPVFVDIDPVFYTMDPQKLEDAVTPRTKAIVPVHLYGQPADLNPMIEIAARRKLRLIEDCAQAHGATYNGRRVGSYGDIGCFSFYPTKNLGAIGDGGMLVTNDPVLAKKARLLREYGWAERYVSHLSGWNSRLDELQSAILRVKLRHLDRENAMRMQIARRYSDQLSDCGIVLPMTRRDSTHVFHLFVVRSDQRDALQAFLKQNDIGALVHYPVPVHRQPAYTGRVAGSDNLAITERVAEDVLSLPLYPEMTDSDAQSVIDAVMRFCSGKREDRIVGN
jgi:dTDP-4-amino-4,6-dideoxygalactose transaminase